MHLKHNFINSFSPRLPKTFVILLCLMPDDLPVKGEPLIGEGLTDNGAYLPISLP